MRFARLKLLSGLTALVWVCAPAAAALHGVFSSHGHHYCDEHEAFEEGRGNAAERDAPASMEDGRLAMLRADLLHGGEGHQACPLANLAHPAKKLRLGGPAVAVSALASSECHLVASTPAIAASAAPLSLAPKTSPPLS